MFLMLVHKRRYWETVEHRSVSRRTRGFKRTGGPRADLVMADAPGAFLHVQLVLLAQDQQVVRIERV